MRSKGDSAKVQVYVDDKMQFYGRDVTNGTVTIDKDTLYKIIRLPSSDKHNLRLEFEDDNVELFAFTFG
jgi:hypothetical protein